MNRVGGYDPRLLQGIPRTKAPCRPGAGDVSLNCDKLRGLLGSWTRSTPGLDDELRRPIAAGITSVRRGRRAAATLAELPIATAQAWPPPTRRVRESVDVREANVASSSLAGGGVRSAVERTITSPHHDGPSISRLGSPPSLRPRATRSPGATSRPTATPAVAFLLRQAIAAPARQGLSACNGPPVVRRLVGRSPLGVPSPVWPGACSRSTC